MIFNFLIIYLLSALILFLIISYIKNYQTEDFLKAIEDKFPRTYYEPENVIWAVNMLSFIPILNTLIIIGIIIKLIFKINIFKYD